MLFLPAAFGAGIGDVFVLKSGTTAGGCGEYRAILDSTLLPDTRKLIDAAIGAIANEDNDVPAQEHLNYFFGIKPGDAKEDKKARAQIKSEFRKR